jgi:hypothetical protein
MENLSPNIFVNGNNQTIAFYKLLGLEKAIYEATEFSILDNNRCILNYAEDE